MKWHQNDGNNKLLVVVPGIGQPNFSKKVEILENNLEYFKEKKHDVYVFIYSRNVEIPRYLVEKFNLKLVYETGIVGDFLKKYITPKFIKNYTHVFILLDDAEIQDGFSVEGALNFYNENNLDILSLSYTLDSKISWKIMFSNNVSLKRVANFAQLKKYIKLKLSSKPSQGRVTNFVELMFYIMDTSNYIKYYEYIFFENPWMWGVDFLLYPMGFKIGIIDKMYIKHYFGGTGTFPDGLPDPKEGRNFLKEKFNINVFEEPKVIENIY